MLLSLLYPTLFNHSSSVKRVAIVDWDIHHGNGTQKIFYDDPSVLFISIHRFHNGNFFPFLPDGGSQNVGGERARGKNVNVAWNEKRMGDDEYYAAMDCVILPILKEFKPDIIFVSAGFDAADGDMGETLVSPECFADLTSDLLNVQPKTVLSLEGGYVRSILAKCVERCIGALKRGPTIAEGGAGKGEEDDKAVRDKYAEVLQGIKSSGRRSIESAIEYHRDYWECFKAFRS